MSAFTAAQARDWPAAVAEAQQYVDSTIPTDISAWKLSWDDETRPGRGHAFDAVWFDGEHVVRISGDVYGCPDVYVAGLTRLHHSADEDCGCGKHGDNHE